MKFTSVQTVQSKLAPGVSYTLKKLTHKRRVELNLMIAPLLQKESGYASEREQIEQEIKEAEDRAKIEPCRCVHDGDRHDPNTKRCIEVGCDCRKPDCDEAYQRLLDNQQNSQELFYNEQKPFYVKWGVKSIEGLEVDGQPVTTADQLLELAPEALVDEIVTEILNLMALTREEAKAFTSPSTSMAQVEAQTNVTTAPTASN